MSVLRCCCSEECDQYHTCVTDNQYPNPQLQSVATSGGNRPFGCCGDDNNVSQTVAFDAFTVSVNSVSVAGAKYITAGSVNSRAGHIDKTWLVAVQINYTLSFNCDDASIPDDCEQLSGTADEYVVLRFGCATLGYPNTFLCTGSYPDSYYNAPNSPNTFNATVEQTNGISTIPTITGGGQAWAIECGTALTPTFFQARTEFYPVLFSSSAPDPQCPTALGISVDPLTNILTPAFSQRINVPASSANPCQPFAQNLFNVVGFAARLSSFFGSAYGADVCRCDSSSGVTGAYPYWNEIVMLETEWSLL